MEKILSNKWDNVILVELVKKALISIKFNNENEHSFFEESSILIVDHPKFKTLKSDIINIYTNGNNNRTVLLSKDFVVKKLNSEVFSIEESIVHSLKKLLINVKTEVLEDKVLILTEEKFNQWLNKSDLEKIAKKLNLVKPVLNLR